MPVVSVMHGTSVRAYSVTVSPAIPLVCLLAFGYCNLCSVVHTGHLIQVPKGNLFM